MALLDIAPSTTPPAGPGSVPPQATDKPKQDTVVLRFEDDSWAEITDAEDKRLLYGTISKGSTKTVQGKSPFKVVLGRSNAVKIEYNGQPFDYRFSEKRGTARFELGAPQQQAGAQRLGPVSPPRIGSTSTAPPRAEPAGAE
jgi:cytoskeleton protein RodZ